MEREKPSLKACCAHYNFSEIHLAQSFSSRSKSLTCPLDYTKKRHMVPPAPHSQRPLMVEQVAQTALLFKKQMKTELFSSAASYVKKNNFRM